LKGAALLLASKSGNGPRADGSGVFFLSAPHVMPGAGLADLAEFTSREIIELMRDLA